MSRLKGYSLSKSPRYKYDVALSFAEQNRPFVEKVAIYLKKNNVTYFYDDDARIKTWGLDLDELLDTVYRVESRFCVMFISED